MIAIRGDELLKWCRVVKESPPVTNRSHPEERSKKGLRKKRKRNPVHERKK